LPRSWWVMSELSSDESSIATAEADPGIVLERYAKHDAVLFRCFAGCDAKDILAELRCGGIVDPAAERGDRPDREAERRGMSEIEGKVVEMAPWFRLRCFNEITIGTDRAYLAKGIVPRTGLVVVWGAPKCGKSFRTFDLVMHVALGWEDRGRLVHQGPVVYLALEGGKGFEGRIEAFRQRYLQETPDQVPFYLIADPINLAKDHGDLIGCSRLQACPPAVVVIDTLKLRDDQQGEEAA
jgi:hypothetical protein